MTRQGPAPADRAAGGGAPLLSDMPDQETRELLGDAPVAAHVLTGGGVVAWANRAELELLGYSEDEHVGRAIADVHVDRAHALDLLARLAAGQPVRDYQASLRARDGSVKDVLITASVRAGAARCFTVDVTEHRRLHQRLEAFLESSASVVYLRDLEGRHLLVNRSYELLAGLPRQQLLGRTDEEIVGEQIARTFRADDRRVIDSGQSIQLEHRFPVNGELRTFLTTKFPLRDAAGRVYAVGGMSTDITDRKRAEDAAREGERQLRLITDALPVLITLVGADGRYRFVNRAYESWFGEPRENILGKTVTEVVGEAAASELRPHIEAVLRGEEVTFEADMAYRHGTNRIISATYAPHHGEGGQLEGFVALVSDVTEHRRAEDRIRFLAEASAILSSSLDYATTLRSVATLAVPRLADWCGVEIVLPDGGNEQLAVAHVDPAKVELAMELRRRYPLPADAPRGLPNVLRTGASELYADVSDELLAQGARDAEHLRIIRELGLRSVIIVPMATRGKVVGAITLVSAESGRRFGAADLALAEQLGSRAALAMENAALYREAQQAIRKRDDFLSVASHELRTPLTTLRLQMDGLLRAAALQRLDKLPPDVHQARLRNVSRQVERLSVLVNQLLDVSRISGGGLELDRVDVDLGELVSEIASRFEEQAQQAGCALTVEIRDPARGRWDRNRIDQVITNLLSNAIKYGAGAPVNVSVQAEHGLARVAVSDRGLGIAPDDQRRIFERFERTEPARNFPGLGLGLWITKQIVDAHGGQITVRSAPDQGATFVVELPVAVVENASS